MGIKKNQHGDFMVTEVAEGGVAALSGKVCVGDVVVAVDNQSVMGVKSAVLRDLIMGAPGSVCNLSLSRWHAEGGEGGGKWESVTVQLTRRKKSAKKKQPPANKVALPPLALPPCPASLPCLIPPPLPCLILRGSWQGPPRVLASRHKTRVLA